MKNIREIRKELSSADFIAELKASDALIIAPIVYDFPLDDLGCKPIFDRISSPFANAFLVDVVGIRGIGKYSVNHDGRFVALAAMDLYTREPTKSELHMDIHEEFGRDGADAVLRSRLDDAYNKELNVFEDIAGVKFAYHPKFRKDRCIDSIIVMPEFMPGTSQATILPLFRRVDALADFLCSRSCMDEGDVRTEAGHMLFIAEHGMLYYRPVSVEEFPDDCPIPDDLLENRSYLYIDLNSRRLKKQERGSSILSNSDSGKEVAASRNISMKKSRVHFTDFPSCYHIRNC